jgi:hypothetical protein
MLGTIVLHKGKINVPEVQEDHYHPLQQRQKFSWRTTLRRLLPRLLVRLLLPFILYQVVGRFFPVSEFARLCIVATPPLFLTTTTLLRKRRIDLLGALVLSGFALSLLLALFTGDARFLSLKPALLDGLFGIICLGSLAFPQPLACAIHKYVVTGGASVREGWLVDVLWQEPSLRSTFLLVTRVMGCGLIVVMILCAFLVFFLNLGLSRAIVPFLSIGMAILLGLWAFRTIASALHRLRVKLPSLSTNVLKAV